MYDEEKQLIRDSATLKELKGLIRANAGNDKAIGRVLRLHKNISDRHVQYEVQKIPAADEMSEGLQIIIQKPKSRTSGQIQIRQPEALSSLKKTDNLLKALEFIFFCISRDAWQEKHVSGGQVVTVSGKEYVRHTQDPRPRDAVSRHLLPALKFLENVEVTTKRGTKFDTAARFIKKDSIKQTGSTIRFETDGDIWQTMESHYYLPEWTYRMNTRCGFKLAQSVFSQIWQDRRQIAKDGTVKHSMLWTCYAAGLPDPKSMPPVVKKEKKQEQKPEEPPEPPKAPKGDKGKKKGTPPHVCRGILKPLEDAIKEFNELAEQEGDGIRLDLDGLKDLPAFEFLTDPGSFLKVSLSGELLADLLENHEDNEKQRAKNRRRAMMAKRKKSEQAKARAAN